MPHSSCLGHTTVGERYQKQPEPAWGLERESAAGGGPHTWAPGEAALPWSCCRVPTAALPSSWSVTETPALSTTGVCGAVRCSSKTPDWKGKEERAYSPHSLFWKQRREQEWEKETSLAFPF